MGRQTRLQIRVAVYQTLPCRTAVLVLLGNVDEILFAEAPVGLAVGGQRLGHVGPDASLFARQDFFAAEVATVCHDVQILDPGCSPSLLRHRGQRGAVVANVGNLMCDDQVMLVVNGGLHVVADHTCASPTGSHGACVRIGQ